MSLSRRLELFVLIAFVLLLLGVSRGETAFAHTVLRDIEYASVDGISLKLDLYLPDPETNAPVPLVIWVHGGGWRSGSKDQSIAPAALGEDYAIASVDYRLTGNATFPAQIHDVKAAVRWLRAHAIEYGFDPQRFGAWGSSAGGHLVALLGVSCGSDELEGSVGDHLNESSCVQAVCDFYGPTDLLALLEQRGGRNARRAMAEDLLLGGLVEENIELANLASPITHISTDVPPFLIMHGSDDEVVPVEQSIAFDNALNDSGIATTLIIVEGAGHGFPRDHLLPVKPFFDQWLLDEDEPLLDTGAVSAVFRDGQTFLTWSEGSGEFFAIFRSTSPIQWMDDPNRPGPLAIVAVGSSRNERASSVEKKDIHYVIEVDEPELTAATGLLVYTVEEAADAYYAAASCTVNGEIVSWIGATGPVSERVAVPQPVRQSANQVGDHIRAHYVHWAPHLDTGAAKALCNRPYYSFDFIVWEPIEPEMGGAALFSLHGGGGTYANAVPPPLHPELTVVSPGSLIPGSLADVDRSWDAWYGYNENVGTDQPLTNGLNIDYTTRRLQWMAEWLTSSYPAIDENRLFLRGSSMGGVGTVFTSILLRDVFAAGLAIVPRFDYGAEDVFLESFDTFGTRWGSIDDNLPTSDGMGVFDRLDAGYLARAYPEWDFAPVWAFNGRNDTAVGWSEKIPFYETMNDTLHGWSFFWDLRAHGGQAPFPKAWRENGWEERVFDWMIDNLRFDQSYPAFSNCSIDDDPGSGDINDGDAIGTINGYLRWETESLDETETRWSIVLFLDAEAHHRTCTVDVTPRRLQKLLLSTGERVRYQVISRSGDVLMDESTTTNALDLLTLPEIPVPVEGIRLTVQLMN